MKEIVKKVSHVLKSRSKKKVDQRLEKIDKRDTAYSYLHYLIAQAKVKERKKCKLLLASS